MSQKKQDIISNLRAIIISCKGGLPLVHIQNDYQEAFGEKVPIKDLGYTSLKDLFEKNSSEFRVLGDKVEVVVKSNSAHIKSLVNRQKGKSKHPRNVRTTTKNRHQRSQNSVGASRNTSNRRQGNLTEASKEFNEKNSTGSNRGGQKHGGSGIEYVERVTLRKPRSYGGTDVPFPGPVPKPTSFNAPHMLENTENWRSFTKTITNNRYLEPKAKTPDSDITQAQIFVEPFENVEDLPIVNSAQSRLLRQKYKMLEDFKTLNMNENSSESPSSPEGSVPYFDLEPYDSPPNLSSPISNDLNSPVGGVPNLPGVFSRQKAQARIANIKSSMQNLVQNMNLYENEVNNNKTTAADKKQESNGNVNPGYAPNANWRSSDNEPKARTAIKKKNSFESPENERAQIDANNLAGDNSNLRSRDAASNGSQEMVYVNKLNELCKLNGFVEPCYKIIVREPKNEPKHYICKVQIEDYLQISSYPIETQDPYSAKEIAAKKMYNYCVTDETFIKSHTENEEKLIMNVLEIVAPTYGIWSDKLPALYKDYYKEDISKNWLSIIMKTAFFEIDNFDGRRFIIRKKTDISTIIPESALPAKEAKIVQSEKRKLLELKLPESEYWEIYITNINNSDEIWCRLIGENYSDAYDAMMTKLELEPPERKTTKPTVGGIYSIKVSAIWYRVRLEELMSDNQALAFFIDIGDKDIVDSTELYEPEDMYFTVAPQAIMLSLYELGSFSGDEEFTSVITGSLLGNTYIGQIITVSQETKSCEQIRRTVRLWDTSTDHDVNVNLLLLNNIIKNIGAPRLPNTSQIKEVLVSSINDNGDIYIQTVKKSVHHLECIIFNKIRSLEGNSISRKANSTIGTDILYLTKCRRRDIFCRAKVIEIENLTAVGVLFVDYGDVERIAVSDLIHLEKSSILQAIPAQAIKVKLSNATFFNQNIVSKLREIVLDQNVLMKVVSSNKGGVPSVEFFKRSMAGNTLYSVNVKITSDPELRNTVAPSRRKSVVVGLENVLPQHLKAPDLPKIGELFEVFVTLASSPDLFIVQPLSSRMELMKMMNELQDIFGGNKKSPVMAEEFVIGELYAVLHPDGNWYRGCAQAVVGSYNYSVYMCDFGDCIMVTKDKLKPLPKKFKNFPYQAVRATLSGIPPELRDCWTPVDCITFHRLVVEKYFVSTVTEINRDKRNENYVNLSLILTDTSGEEDIYIHKVLLERRNESTKFIKGQNVK